MPALRNPPLAQSGTTLRRLPRPARLRPQILATGHSRLFTPRGTHAMTPEALTELRAIVRAILAEHGHAGTHAIILDAHNGRLGRARHPRVTNNNMHLFRQYRNRVSADPAHMIQEAEITP